MIQTIVVITVALAASLVLANLLVLGASAIPGV